MNGKDHSRFSRLGIGPALAVMTVTVGAASHKAARRKPPARPAAKAVSFKKDVQPILTSNCATGGGCHAGEAPAAGLKLDTPDPYAALVDAPSSLDPKRKLVKPGKPDESILWLKVTGKHTQAGLFGDRMPPGKPLSAARLRAIERWIRGGARR